MLVGSCREVRYTRAMKHREIVTIPERKEERVTSISCDLCSAKGRARIDAAEWGDSAGNNVNETEVRLKTGYSCPDGGNGDQYVIDICPTCFENKLIPWLRSQGAKVEKEEWDW